MIENTHPGVQLLAESKYKCHLIGSRFIGPHDRDRADWDFLVEGDTWYDDSGLRAWLEANGFKCQGEGGYGPDHRLYGTNAWTLRTDDWPHIDVLPVSPDEADMRMRFFRMMRLVLGDDRGGRLSLSLKRGKNWAALWDCVAAMEKHGLPFTPYGTMDTLAGT